MHGTRRTAVLSPVATILFLLLALSTPANAATPAERGTAGPKSRPNDQILELFGERMLEVISSAERVESFTVARAVPGGGTPGNAGTTGAWSGPAAGYVPGAAGSDLTAAQIAEIQELLTDPNSFLFGYVKKCLFIPDRGLRFVSRLGEVEILFSSVCRTFLAFFAPGESLDSGGVTEAYEDYDPIAQRIDALFTSVLGGGRD